MPVSLAEQKPYCIRYRKSAANAAILPLLLLLLLLLIITLQVLRQGCRENAHFIKNPHFHQ